MNLRESIASIPGDEPGYAPRECSSYRRAPNGGLERVARLDQEGGETADMLVANAQREAGTVAASLHADVGQCEQCGRPAQRWRAHRLVCNACHDRYLGGFY